jgi:hypothetical protein
MPPITQHIIGFSHKIANGLLDEGAVWMLVQRLVVATRGAPKHATHGLHAEVPRRALIKRTSRGRARCSVSWTSLSASIAADAKNDCPLNPESSARGS